MLEVKPLECRIEHRMIDFEIKEVKLEITCCDACCSLESNSFVRLSLPVISESTLCDFKNGMLIWIVDMN
jgi:hypothetical protein